MRSTLLFLSLLVLVIACKNLEDADPANRKTFTKYYEGPYNFSASDIDTIPGGFAILGNSFVSLKDTSFTETVLFTVDESGTRTSDYHYYSGGTGKSFKYFNNGTFSGYIIIGDSIYTDLSAEQAANVTISSMRIVLVNSNFGVKRTDYLSDEEAISLSHPIKIDYFGGAVNVSNTGVIFLGTYKDGVINQQSAPEKQLLLAYDANLDSLWSRKLDLVGETYSNAKSIHYSGSNLVWASAIANVQGDFISSWVTIPFVQEESIYDNFSQIGQTTAQLFIPKDIQPTKIPGFGFGVVGTYSQNTNGTKGNMFFFRVDTNGDIVPGSDKYYDAIESLKPDSLDINKDFSTIVDEGEAICSTSDGGFILAGSYTTNTLKGNGGKDLILIKVSITGDIIWMKTIGGSGDEVPNAIIETSNGDLLICGTNTIGDYSSIFLMKTDKNGELKK